VAEIERTLAFHGQAATPFLDCGVAGLWRLLEQRAAIAAHPVVIAVAGMEGALFSVLGGLVGGLLIAVPASVGYGVAAGGRAALQAGLASCAPGVVVVNIDNGYGAACAALRALHVAHCPADPRSARIAVAFELGQLDGGPELDFVQHRLQPRVIGAAALGRDQLAQRRELGRRQPPVEEGQAYLLECAQEPLAALLRTAAAGQRVLDLLECQDCAQGGQGCHARRRDGNRRAPAEPPGKTGVAATAGSLTPLAHAGRSKALPDPHCHRLLARADYGRNWLRRG
jgi:hypothetical protein